MSLLITGLLALDKALPAYNTAEAYYEGTVDETFSTEAVRKALGKSIGDFSFNYSRLVITSRLNRMEVSSIATVDKAANEVLETVWTDNAMDQEIQDAIEACLVFGDSYLMAFPNEDDGVDVFFNDPRTTRVFYEIENPRKKSYAIKRWTEGDKLRVNLYYADRIEKWVSKGKPKTQYKDGDFEKYYDEGSNEWPLANDTGEIPVFHLRTNRLYGRPEHASSFPAQNAISKIISVQVSSIDYASFPQRYFLQDPAANDGINPAADFGGLVDNDDNDSVTNLKSGPGGVWNLQGIKQVGQFDVAAPNTFIEPFKAYIDSISATTQTPMHLFQVGALPSGESLRAAEAPLNKRIESLELQIGGVLRELHEYVLGLSGYEGLTVSVQWAPVASYDDADVWAVVDAKVSAGVPLRVALMQAGFTDEQVSEWYPEGTSARTTKEIAVLAEAIQKLGAASTLGVVTLEEVRALLPKDIILTEVVNVDSVVDAAEAIEPTNASDAGEVRTQADALGVLIRAGVDPDEAARRVGLGGVAFTGAMPTSLRLPAADANKLEQV